jgi:hypothetical protein
MTFASNLSRGLTLGALAMGLTLSSVNAQNGTNYHILSNGLDVIYGGIGAGGTQTKADGLGTWVAGEDMRGSHKVAFSGDWGYRNTRWRESACPIKLPVGGGALAIQFRGLSFIEMDGLNGNNPSIFLAPACTNPSFPLGGSAGFIPYGVGPGSSASFVVSGLPAGVGPAPSSTIVLPNNGLVPSSSGGLATIVAAASNITVPIASSGFCWGVQFTWVPSALPFTDDIDGLWHYAINGDGNNQYWAFSNDEMNVWQSNSVASDAGVTQAIFFPASTDYDFLLLSVEPNTMATLAPRGVNLTGPYYNQTENVRNQNGVPLNPNGGFDVGRGSRTISFSGTAGVPNPTTGLGNQNPANNPGTITTLGFLTWDNGGDNNGSVRVTWMSLDFLSFARVNPQADPGIAKFGGTIRVPVVSAGFLQPITASMFNVFQHVTSTAPSGFPDPGGFASGAFNTPAIAGASWQVPTGNLPAACTGTKLNVTYGTSGRTGGVGSAGGLTWDPSVADTSGTKELFLFN